METTQQNVPTRTFQFNNFCCVEAGRTERAQQEDADKHEIFLMFIKIHKLIQFFQTDSYVSSAFFNSPNTSKKLHLVSYLQAQLNLLMQ